MIGRNLSATLRGAILALAVGATTLIAQTAGVQTRASQQALTPKQAAQMLKDGNERFLNGGLLKRDLRAKAPAAAVGQFPYAVILSCIDSRTSSELIMDLGFDDAFNVGIVAPVDAIAERNVRLTIEEIRAKSPVISELEQKGSVMIVDGMHDIATGRIRFFA